MKASKLFNEINELLRIHNATDCEILNISEDGMEIFVDGVLEMIDISDKRIYYNERLDNPIVLENEKYKNYEYYIITLGSHPCCYVLLPKGHKYYGKNYDEIGIKCHYGLTYANNKLLKNNVIENGEWVIGWDYAHLDDYVSYDSFYSSFLEGDVQGHKYSLDELRKEVYDVINQLVN